MDTTNNQTAPELPANFKSWGDVLRAQQEAQAALTRTNQELAELKKQQTTPKPSPSAADPLGLSTPPAATKKFSYEEFQADVLKNGGRPSVAMVTSMAAAGFDDASIANLASTVFAEVSVKMEKAAEAVGGKTELDATIEWAKNNLTEVEKTALNQVLRTPFYVAAVKDLHAKRLAAAPTDESQEPDNAEREAVSAGTGNEVVEPFTSLAEQNKAYRDPRFNTDPKYRANVQARAYAAAKLGTIKQRH